MPPVPPIRRALAQHVKREQRREVLRQDALKAWSAWQKTGRHVSHAEADEWLAKLEAGQDVEPPECRD